MKTRSLLGAAFALTLTLGFTSSAFAQDPGPSKTKDSGPAPATPADQQKTDQQKTDQQKQDSSKDDQMASDYAKAIKDLPKSPGAFTFYQRKKELLLELPMDKLNKTFLIQAAMDTGITSMVLQAGDPLGGNEVDAYHFERHDDQVWLVRPNLRFRWGSDDDLKTAAQRSLPMAILSSFRIEQEDPKKHLLLVNVTSMFFGDMFRLNDVINAMLGGQYGLDRDKSGVDSIKSFDQNAVIQAHMHYFSPRGADGQSIADLLGLDSANTLEDDRSVPLKVTYNMWFRQPDGYVPRLADGRIGYFTEDFYSLAKFLDRDRTKRYIFRWNLKKKDPTAAMSEPVKPIVWTVDPSVPEKYRDAVKDGVLRWNRAFEELGYKNAIQVQDAPKDDKDYDHADGRYNVIRWTFSPDAGYAVSLARVDPFTGEILNASVTVDANMLAYILNDYQYSTTAIVDAHARAEKALLTHNDLKVSDDQYLWSNPKTDAINAMRDKLAKLGWSQLDCQQESGLADSASFALATAQAMGQNIDKDAYAKQYISDTVCHEIGHCLGLRHNFAGSTYLSTAQLADDALTSKDNVTASVMDYVPVNMVAVLKGTHNYFGTTVGPYDRWAIQYGYSDFGSASPEGEAGALAKIASKAGQPGLVYQTDENADSWNPYAVRFDNASDPINYSADELNAAKRLREYAITFLPRPGENYDLRSKLILSSIMRTFREGRMSARFVGGISAQRSYKGDAVERPTLAPVSPTLQRQAMSLIANNCFAPEAFNLPSDVLETMSFDPTDPDNAGWNAPIREMISSNQMLLYATMMSGDTTERISENAYKLAGKKGAYTMDEHFGLMLGAVFKEVGQNKPISPVRRDLQRFALHALMIQAGAPEGRIAEDARTVASDSLKRLETRFQAASTQPNLDGMTRVYERDAADTIKRFINRQTTG